MIKSDLLKECIADAKAIQATALANAKASLEEAFAPKLKEMLSAKLAEEASFGDESGAPTEEFDSPSEETVTEEEVNEILAELEGGTGSAPVPTDAVAPAAPVDPTAPAPVVPTPVAPVAPAAPMDTTPPVPAPVPTDDVDPSPAPAAQEEEINIEELLNSLEEGSEEEEEEEKLDETVGDVEKAGTQKDRKDPSCPKGGKTSGIGSKKQEFDATLEENTEEEEEVNLDELLNSMDETVGDVMPAGTSTKGKEKITAKGGPVAKKYGSELKKGGSDYGSAPTNKVYENIEEEEEEENLKEELDEHKRTCEFLKGQLNEVNLLNAKLLYTNKLFKANSLNNSQKMKIIEAFDLTKSIREVKLTYAAMNEAMNLGSGLQKKNHMIAESLASKPIGTTKPGNEKLITEEVNVMASRFQTLAGIKKSQ